MDDATLLILTIVGALYAAFIAIAWRDEIRAAWDELTHRTPRPAEPVRIPRQRSWS